MRELQENFIAAPCGVGRKVCSIVWGLPTAAVMATSHPWKSPEGHSTGKQVRALLIAESFKPWMAHILHQGEKPGFLPLPLPESLDFASINPVSQALLRKVQDVI